MPSSVVEVIARRETWDSEVVSRGHSHSPFFSVVDVVKDVMAKNAKKIVELIRIPITKVFFLILYYSLNNI